MLHRFVYGNWEDPPEAMAFSFPYLQAVAKVRRRLHYVRAGALIALKDPAAMPGEYWQAALELFLYMPSLVNVALNYKICIEQGLPLHATQYFEVNEGTRGQVLYSDPQKQAAQAFFLAAIEASVAVCRLDPAADAMLERLATDIPPGVGSFLYTSTRDRYTWRASEPGKIRELAEDVQKHIQPVLLLGAAHGAIMAGLILATLIPSPLYFVRFSLFKRHDTEPVLGPSDLRFLDTYKAGPVLLFDEDVAKGTTLALFTERLSTLFDVSYSAGVLRHGHAGFRPDFVGRVWYD